MSHRDEDLLGLTAAHNIDSSASTAGGPAQQAMQYYLSLKMAKVPNFTPPDMSQENLCPLPNCSQEEINEFRSAGVLLKALAAEAKAWSTQLPPTYYPAIIAILHGGLQVQVRTLTQVSFDGIRIEGLLGDSPCSILAHQNTVQLICHALRQEEEQPQPHPIGFIWPDHNENVPHTPAPQIGPEPAVESDAPSPGTPAESRHN
jgi:hypothetical protein